MGHDPQFEWDIFVSYRHVADQLEGKWVTTFCDNLALLLDELLGAQPKIWRDKDQLRAGDEWRPEIGKALESASIFLAIISQSYMQSKVCRQELDEFLGYYKYNKDANVATSRLILPVYKQPPTSDIPPDIRDIHRPRAFYREHPSGWDEFGPGRETEKDFWAALSKLAQELKVQLERIRGHADPQRVGTVYLGEVGLEVQSGRDNIQADLLQRRYRVLPELSYIWNASDIKDKINVNLESADLAVLLIGRHASKRSGPADHTRMQIDLAVGAMSHRLKPPPLVWIEPGPEPEADDIRELIRYVRDELPGMGVEIFESSLEDFKTHVVSKLPKAPSKIRTGVVGREVAVLLDEQEVVASTGLKRILAENLKIEPLPILVLKSAANKPIAEVSIPSHCDYCIIFWGAQPESWVRKVLLLQDLLKRGSKRVCVYIAGPESVEKQGYVTSKATIVRAACATDDDTGLSAFLCNTAMSS